MHLHSLCTASGFNLELVKTVVSLHIGQICSDVQITYLNTHHILSFSSSFAELDVFSKFENSVMYSGINWEQVLTAEPHFSSYLNQAWIWARIIWILCMDVNVTHLVFSANILFNVQYSPMAMVSCNRALMTFNHWQQSQQLIQHLQGGLDPDSCR